MPFSATAAPLFMGVGDLPGGIVDSVAWSVSDDGSTVVGASTSSQGPQPFIWRAGTMESLSTPTDYSEAYGVSADGRVVVGGLDRWEDGVWEPLSNDDETEFLIAFATTPDGQLAAGAGYSCPPCNHTAAYWLDGVITSLGQPAAGALSSFAYAVSSAGNAFAGAFWATPTSGLEAFLWTETDGMAGLGDLPGGLKQSQANGISADGEAIVGWGMTGTGTEAFLWRDGSMLGLGATPGRNKSSANAISGDGRTVVGDSWLTPGRDNEAFIWIEGEGMLAVSDLLVNRLGLDLGGWSLTGATDISSDGRVIVGRGRDPQGNNQGWIAVIDEPSSSALLGVVATALLARRRILSPRGGGIERRC
jgi:probable HAF family extracellular repeat protein